MPQSADVRCTCLDIAIRIGFNWKRGRKKDALCIRVRLLVLRWLAGYWWVLSKPINLISFTRQKAPIKKVNTPCGLGIGYIGQFCADIARWSLFLRVSLVPSFHILLNSHPFYPTSTLLPFPLSRLLSPGLVGIHRLSYHPTVVF